MMLISACDHSFLLSFKSCPNFSRQKFTSCCLNRPSDHWWKMFVLFMSRWSFKRLDIDKTP